MGNVAFTDTTGGLGQKLVLREAQMYGPSVPVTSALARIWVHEAPRLPAS